MKTDHTLPVERLRELVNYDTDSGNFFTPDGEPLPSWRAGRYGRIQINPDGNRLRYAARCAWAHYHGEWPAGQVDHINGDHTDNRIANLRDLTNAQNAQNRTRAKSDNPTGLLGVSVDRRSSRYRARIMLNGRMKSLGYHATPEDAHEAYLAAKRELHPHWVENPAA